MTFDQIVVVIPAFEPDLALNALISQLRAIGFSQIVVINDGSSSKARAFFERTIHEGAVVLNHETNRGKGRALKTGFDYVLNNYPAAIGVVTCDADGQHLASDVEGVTRAFLCNPASLTLGTRNFESRRVPLRCRFGNALTKIVFRVLVGTKLTDTQTGLRAFPRSLLPPFINLRAERYDFELEMLLYTLRQHTAVQQIPITTIYENGNRLSHFNPVLDSLRIYFVFARFLLGLHSSSSFAPEPPIPARSLEPDSCPLSPVP